MKDDELTPKSKVVRNRLIQLLNQELASEYQAIIAYIVYSEVLKRASYTAIAAELELHAADEFQHAMSIAKQIKYLGGVPCVSLTAPKTAPPPAITLPADPADELATVGHHRYPIRQAVAVVELPFTETLRAVIVQHHEHEIDLAAALGMDVRRPKPARTSRRKAEQNLVPV